MFVQGGLFWGFALDGTLDVENAKDLLNGKYRSVNLVNAISKRTRRIELLRRNKYGWLIWKKISRRYLKSMKLNGTKNTEQK